MGKALSGELSGMRRGHFDCDYELNKRTAHAKGKGLDPVKHVCTPSPQLPSSLLLAVPRRYFCCVSSVLHVVMSMCIWSPAIWSPV